MDFVHDQLDDGRWYRVFTAVDDFTRESVALEAATSLPAAKVTEVLDAAIGRRGLPRRIVCDNGSEFTSLWFMQWAARHGIDIQFIQPGKPTQNAFAESFNGCFRDECPNTHWFSTLPQARHEIAQWQRHYNAERPHGSLGKQTTEEFRLTYLSPEPPGGWKLQYRMDRNTDLTSVGLYSWLRRTRQRFVVASSITLGALSCPRLDFCLPCSIVRSIAKRLLNADITVLFTFGACRLRSHVL
jgi:hypothetical protein